MAKPPVPADPKHEPLKFSLASLKSTKENNTSATRTEVGKDLVIFTALPEALDRNNIQVKGTGEATLGEGIFETEFFVENMV